MVKKIRGHWHCLVRNFSSKKQNIASYPNRFIIALKAAREVNYVRTKINALILLGSSCFATNDLSQAKSHFQAAADSATLANMHDEKLRIFTGFAVVAEKEGNYRDAFLYKKRVTVLSDSIFNANRSKLILEYQEKFQTEQ